MNINNWCHISIVKLSIKLTDNVIAELYLFNNIKFKINVDMFSPLIYTN